MLVSVVMPTYNCGKYIAKSIESVLVQTLSDWELQIVDDCSTDDTIKILQPYLEKYHQIHYYKLPKNGGPAVARTEAIKRSNGKYIAFLDSDDLWFPDKLEKQIAFMQEQNFEFSCTAYSCMMMPEKVCTMRYFHRNKSPIQSAFACLILLVI